LEIIDVLGSREMPTDPEVRKQHLADYMEEIKANIKIKEIKDQVVKLTCQFPINLE
jgi:hypothetical protein